MLWQIVAEAPKHERIVCSDAANTRNDDFARAAFVIYKTPEKAAKAVQKLSKMRIYQTPRPKSESLVGQREGCFAEMAFSSPGRVSHEK